MEGTQEYFNVRRNNLSQKNTTIFKEDLNKKTTLVSNDKKQIHFNNAVISDDSSELSYTEVKLGQFYEKSQKHQDNLKKACEKKRNNEKLAGALLSLVHIDRVKQYTILWSNCIGRLRRFMR